MIEDDDLEYGVVIDSFPKYEITNFGRVFNRRTGHRLALSPVTPVSHGDLTVGLVVDGRQYRRSVKVLVAKHFVHGQTEIFNTPVQLDGNRYNLHASNIVWRPRWFAWKYSRQFIEEAPEFFWSGPIVDVANDVEYDTIFDAAVATGSLAADIRLAIINADRVFPGWERYHYI